MPILLNHFICQMKFRIIASFFLFIMALEAYAQPILWNIKNIDGIKNNTSSKLYKQIIQKADKYVGAEYIDITKKSHQFVDDTHYYVSLATYYWPDTTRNDGKYVLRDGYINPERENYDRVKLYDLCDRLTYLSLAFYMEHQDKYYAEFIKLLKGWFCDNSTYVYPNLEYAQIVPGYNKNRGNRMGLIEARSYNDILESIRTIDIVKPIDRDIMSSVKWWFYEFSRWLIESKLGLEEDNAIDNHGTSYDLILLNIAQFTNQKELASRITDNFYQRRLATQISEDGSMHEELKRTNSLSYSILNLSFIIDFCVIQQNMGVSYYNQKKWIIDRAISFLQEHLSNGRAWSYSQLSSIDWEKKRLSYEVNRLLRIDSSNTNRNVFRIELNSEYNMLK